MSENNYTKIENCFLHGLCRAKIRAPILQTILAIFRATVGYHLPERILSYEQITRWTGFDRRNQRRYIKEALKKNFITRYNTKSEIELVQFKKQPSYSYSVNFDAFSWLSGLRLPERHFSGKVRVSSKQPPECSLNSPHSLSSIQTPPFLKNLLKG